MRQPQVLSAPARSESGRLPSPMPTGGLCVKGIGAAHYKSFTIDDSAWPPK